MTPLASAVLGLQAAAGNSATVRALARSGLLARAPGGSSTPAGAAPPAATPAPSKTRELRTQAKADAEAVWELEAHYKLMGDDALRRLARSDPLAKQVLAERRWAKSQWTPAREQAGDFDTWEGHKLPHEATATAQDANGKVIWRGWERSGNMTPAEKALPFPLNMNCTHTEARLVDRAILPRGGKFTIIGQYDPCVACQNAMRTAAVRSGCRVEYWWPGAPDAVGFVADPPASALQGPITLRAWPALAHPQGGPPPRSPAPPLPEQLELPLGLKPPPVPAAAPLAGVAAPRPPALPQVSSGQLELPFGRAVMPEPVGGGGVAGWGPALADFGLFLLGNAVMTYMYKEQAAREQGMFDATRPEIEARAAALAEQARSRQAELRGRTIWINVRLLPTYWRVEDAKPYEESEYTSLNKVQVGMVTLGDEYRSAYTQGEPTVIMTNGAYVNVWERHDTLDFSFPFPYDPSVMTRDEIARRIIETEREARRRSELPQAVRDALSAERASLLQARDALAPPPGVEFAP